MNTAYRARILLPLAVVLFLGLGMLSVHRLNANAGGSWSPRDMWDFFRGVKSTKSLKKLSLASAEYESEQVQTAKESDDTFRFPDDRAGQILSKTLPPSEKLSPPASHDAPA